MSLRCGKSIGFVHETQQICVRRSSALSSTRTPSHCRPTLRGMWQPADADEIERAALAGDLVETHSFDAKAALPERNRNASLAIDVCAMTPDGGQLLYGIAEDENERPTVPAPIELAGAPERAEQIAGTSIQEAPYIVPRVYSTTGDPARGYLLVTIPQSARAPHQVTVGGEWRFYGRGETGNRILPQGEIERLYERRQRWEIDREAQLAEIIGLAPVAPGVGAGYLHAFARPVAPDQRLWERAERGERRALFEVLTRAAKLDQPISGYKPALRNLGAWQRMGGDAWALEGDGGSRYYGVRCDVNIDGRGYLFCGRAAQTNSAGTLGIFETIIAGNFASFLSVMGRFYREAGYQGQVDLGLAVTGIEGGISASNPPADFEGREYRALGYTRTDRVPAPELGEPVQIARVMLRHLVAATAGEGFDPFA
jgi:hypothetical protein